MKCNCCKCKHKKYESELMKDYQKYAEKNNLEFVGLMNGTPMMRDKK